MKQVKYETIEYIDDEGCGIGEITTKDNEFYNAQISIPYFTNLYELNHLKIFLTIVEEKMMETKL